MGGAQVAAGGGRGGWANAGGNKTRKRKENGKQARPSKEENEPRKKEFGLRRIREFSLIFYFRKYKKTKWLLVNTK